jgi:hypothetical protein
MEKKKKNIYPEDGKCSVFQNRKPKTFSTKGTN